MRVIPWGCSVHLGFDRCTRRRGIYTFFSLLYDEVILDDNEQQIALYLRLSRQSQYDETSWRNFVSRVAKRETIRGRVDTICSIIYEKATCQCRPSPRLRNRIFICTPNNTMSRTSSTVKFSTKWIKNVRLNCDRWDGMYKISSIRG